MSFGWAQTYESSAMGSDHLTRIVPHILEIRPRDKERKKEER
jgi:hypothetical protein